MPRSDLGYWRQQPENRATTESGSDTDRTERILRVLSFGFDVLCPGRDKITEGHVGGLEIVLTRLMRALLPSGPIALGSKQQMTSKHRRRCQDRMSVVDKRPGSFTRESGLSKLMPSWRCKLP